MAKGIFEIKYKYQEWGGKIMIECNKKCIRFTRFAVAIIMALAMVVSSVGYGAGLGVSKVEAADAEVTVTARALYDYAFEVLDYVNEERAKAGLNALQMDKSLMEAAMIRAAESVVVGEAYAHSEIDNSKAHTRPDGTSCLSILAKSQGENIAYGHTTPYNVMFMRHDRSDGGRDIDENSSYDMDSGSWMRCEGHRKNILYPSWKSIGIGVVYCNGNYYYYWAQQFSTKPADSVVSRTSERVTYRFTVGVTNDVYSRLNSRGAFEEGSPVSSDSYGGSAGQSTAVGGGSEDDPATTTSVKGSWASDAGGWYYMMENGTRAKRCWLKSKGNWYALGEDGYMMTGWRYIDDNYYYFHGDGTMASNEWIDGYWLSGNGAWTYEGVGSWYANSDGWWFEDSSGWYPWSQWQKIDGKWYYFNYYGYAVTNDYVDGYWLGADGAMQ